MRRDIGGRFKGMVRIAVCGVSWRLVAVAVVAALLGGCTQSTQRHDYEWTEFVIKTKRLHEMESLIAGKTVSLDSRPTSDTQLLLGELGAHEYYGSLGQLSRAVASQLAIELSKRGIEVEDNAPKSIRINLSNARLERGLFRIRAHFDIDIEAGNGYSREFAISQSTALTVPRAYNAAVARAVTEILNDRKVIFYLRE